MKQILIVALCLGVSCAPQEPVTTVQGSACAITVSFGSYAMGVDQTAAQAVEARLRADPAVAAVDRKPWGREGEFDLCARIARVQDAQRIFASIKPLLPAAPRGPVTVTLANGASYSAPAS